MSYLDEVLKRNVDRCIAEGAPVIVELPACEECGKLGTQFWIETHERHVVCDAHVPDAIPRFCVTPLF